MKSFWKLADLVLVAQSKITLKADCVLGSLGKKTLDSYSALP